MIHEADYDNENDDADAMSREQIVDEGQEV